MGPHLDLEGTVGTERNLGEADLFVPLAQIANTLHGPPGRAGGGRQRFAHGTRALRQDRNPGSSRRRHLRRRRRSRRQHGRRQRPLGDYRRRYERPDHRPRHRGAGSLGRPDRPQRRDRRNRRRDPGHRSDADYATISGNSIAAPGSTGIFLQDGNAEVTISDNVCGAIGFELIAAGTTTGDPDSFTATLIGNALVGPTGGPDRCLAFNSADRTIAFVDGVDCSF
jgi:hypothetical protein